MAVDRVAGYYGSLQARIVAALRAGKDFKAAAAAAGVSVGTARRWRREDSRFDRRVLDAAAVGVGTVLSPSGRSCPGSHCGTATGYDYGCRGPACTSAKSRQVADSRARGTASIAGK